MAQALLIPSSVALLDPDPEQIDHECDEALLREQLLVHQVDREGGYACTILYRRIHAIGKCAPGSRATSCAQATMHAMLSDDERTRFGQVVHLTRLVIERHAGRQRAAASRTDRRKMLDYLVGVGSLPECLTLVAFCPPGFLAERSRRLVTRTGFLNPSLDGGLPLLELFRPSRRSSSVKRAKRAAICTACA